MKRDARHVLYRFFGVEHDLLYIGISMNAPSRFAQHRADKPWWHEVVDISMEPHATRADVLAAEREAIKAERPRHNIAHNLPAIPIAPVIPAAELLWVCDGCGKQVRPESGYFEVSNAAVAAVEQGEKSWRQRYASGSGLVVCSIDELNEYPERAPWKVWHRKCDPTPRDAAYFVDLERCTTAADLLRWTAHLIEKDWVVKSTNWADFIVRVIGGHNSEPLGDGKPKAGWSL